MSLRPLNAFNPLGQFDVLDTEAASFKGGEICSFTATPTASQPGITGSTDQATYDVFDGYVNQSGTLDRPALSKNWNGTVLAVTNRPILLADDGITGYGTLLGSVVGGTAGQQTTATATTLGPSSLTGSGKLTVWANPGIFAVSLDATDQTAGGLLPTNTALSVGAPLYFTAAGLLTTAANKVAGSPPVVGNLIEFATNGSLVNTPSYLTQALNSPSGSAATTRKFTYVVMNFNPPADGTH